MTYRQRPIKGGRIPVPSYLEARIEKIVQREADRFNVTRAFVITTALADYFGIDVDETYQATRKTRRSTEDRPHRRRQNDRAHYRQELHA